MKLAIILTTVFAISVGLAQLAFSFEQPDGFMGMKWGESIEQCKGKGLCQRTLGVTDNINITMMQGDTNSSIGNVYGLSVTYGFYANKLAIVTVYFLGNENFTKLKAGLKDKYGEPKFAEPLKNVYSATVGLELKWYVSDVLISLEYDEAKGMGEGYLSYVNRLFLQKEEERKKKLEELKKHL